MNTITKHYIDGAFVESHGRELMDIINPTNRTVIAQVTLADDEDARPPSPLPSVHLRRMAEQQKKSGRRSCTGCTRSSRRDSTI